MVLKEHVLTGLVILLATMMTCFSVVHAFDICIK